MTVKQYTWLDFIHQKCDENMIDISHYKRTKMYVKKKLRIPKEFFE